MAKHVNSINLKNEVSRKASTLILKQEYLNPHVMYAELYYPFCPGSIVCVGKRTGDEFHIFITPF